MALGVDASLYCPQHHCLKRIHQGNGAASFSGEQYPDNGYQCAFEGVATGGKSDPHNCACDGYAKYGNFIQSGKVETWSTDVLVNATSGYLACKTALFGSDPISGAKVCWCGPTIRVATSRASFTASDSDNDLGIFTPECFITDVLTEIMGSTTATLYGMGVNQAVINTIVAPALNVQFLTEKTKWLAFNASTLVSTVQVDITDSPWSAEDTLDASGDDNDRTTIETKFTYFGKEHTEGPCFNFVSSSTESGRYTSHVG